ncbi:uncharacterized protein LOC111335068 isoform X1 [Stylophora pistillata]|uniref:uncharacterized protein LOC111335068 isoform X1 n=1 Tax=Stylophora pistillata TaxID=50429 RepID=UPI000C03B9B9|nr:uncharacterized protein LOC111335068 isoform X1 [Stylophora pistillata]
MTVHRTKTTWRTWTTILMPYWKLWKTRKNYNSTLSKQLTLQSSHRFLYSAFRSAGSFQIPIPLLLLHVPQPNTEQFSPGIMSTVFINVFSYILKKAHCQAKHQCSWQIY